MNKAKLLNEQEGKKVIEILKAGESVTLIAAPGAGRTGFATHLAKRVEFSQDKGSKYEFIYLDISLGKNLLEEQLQMYVDALTGKTKVIEGLRELVQEGSKVVIVLDNYEYNASIAKIFSFYRNSFKPNISFLNLIRLKEFRDLRTNHKQVESDLLHNVLYLPYWDNKETENFIQFFSKELDIELSKDKIDRLIAFTGGIAVLVKNYMRFYRKYSTPEEIENSSEMKVLIQKIWNSFSQEEKLELLHVGINGKSSNSDISNALIKLGVILGKKISGEWFGYALKSNRKISPKKGELFIGDFPLVNFLTNTEYTLISYLYENKKSVVTREESIDILFPDSKGGVTDWAVDKFFSRLRKKLKVLKAGDLIETRKRKGYILNSDYY